MNCPECDREMTAPVIVDGTAYLVCDSCGEDVQLPAADLTASVEERIQELESELGLRLPEAYRSFLMEGGDRSLCPFTIRVPEGLAGPLAAYAGSGGIRVEGILGVDKTKPSNLFENSYLIDQWALPERLLLLDGDGHSWVALDYREAEFDPPVIFIESETKRYSVVAGSFDELLEQAGRQ
jgi:hypothetical protein